MIYELPDLKIHNPYLSLAIEDAIAEYCGTHYRSDGISGFIRFWSNSYTIVLGRTSDAHRDIRPEFLERFRPSMNPRTWRHQPMIARRISGGGTVLHGPGNVNFSFFLPVELHPDLYAVRHSYEVFLNMVTQSLQAQGIDCGVRGLSDIVIDPHGMQKKISGNAQFRKYGMICHHGTLLLQRDIISFISRFLKHPPSEPEYRKNRSHDEFLMHLPETFDLSGFYNSLLSRLKSYAKSESAICPQPIRREIIQLAREKTRLLYTSPHWIFEGMALAGAGNV